MIFSRSALFLFFSFVVTSFVTVAQALPIADVGDGYICSRHRQPGSVYVTGFIGSTGRNAEVRFNAIVARGRIVTGSYQQSSGAAFDLIEVLNDRTIPSIHKKNLKKIRRYAACCENENGPLCPEPPTDPRIIISPVSATPEAQLSDGSMEEHDNLNQLFKRKYR